ncbi:MAG: hypothetical protein MJE68_32420 [Proteobacteria bacterium]|nr:hypothetical protein [Pseudomonadota bacterium]
MLLPINTLNLYSRKKKDVNEEVKARQKKNLEDKVKKNLFHHSDQLVKEHKHTRIENDDHEKENIFENQAHKETKKKGKKKKNREKTYSWSDYDHNDFVKMGRKVAENKTGYEFGKQFDFRHHVREQYWDSVVKNFFEMPRKTDLKEYMGINFKVNFERFVSYLETLHETHEDTTQK